MRLWRTLIILNLTIAISLSGLPALSKAQNMGNDCLLCHGEVYKKGVSSVYQHSPFKKRACGACHLKQGHAIQGKGVAKLKAAERVILSKPDYLTEHTIILKGLINQAIYRINIIFKDLSGNKIRTSFGKVIPARIQDIKTYERKPPVISGIRVGSITKSVFLETTITWDTDELSTSCVEYGLSDRYGECTSEDIVLVKHHRIRIYELEEGKDYHFRVISRDMFGNKAVSEDCVFSTAKVLQVSGAEEKGDSNIESVKLAVKKAHAFLRRKKGKKSDIGLYLETTKPANVTIEYMKVRDGCTDLNVGKGLTIDACYQCHPPDVLGLSHPVGVAAKGTTRIPDDLPALTGGIITCVTCHNVHGGNMKHFVRRETTSCDTCHGD